MYPLYIVATPIGNLEDITLRALRILKEVRVIFCESPAQTKKLLAHYRIRGKLLLKYTAHQERRLIPRALEILKKEPAALVSNAGTPAISDPGAGLVSEILARGGKVISVPGPSALSAAIAISGISGRKFLFISFFPRKRGDIARLLADAEKEKAVLVGYESPYRIQKTLAVIAEEMPNTFAVIARELTKIHEEILRGTAEELSASLQARPEKVRGEFVLMVAPGKRVL